MLRPHKEENDDIKEESLSDFDCDRYSSSEGEIIETSSDEESIKPLEVVYDATT